MEDLIRVLSDAANQDAEKIRRAQAQLQQWEIQPGFHRSLQQVVFESHLAFEIRWIAVIQFKHGVIRYWRKNMPKFTISSDEKAIIRSQVLEGIAKLPWQLAVQNAVALAKISRFDYPTEWPTLLEDLLFYVKDSQENTEVKANSLNALSQVIKTMCANRIIRARHIFYQVAPKCFSVIAEIYLSSFDKWSTQKPIDELDQGEMTTSIGALKVLRRLLIYGWESCHHAEPCRVFIRILFAHYCQLVNFSWSGWTQIVVHTNKFSLLYKHIKLMGKIFVTLASDTPVSFLLMPGILDFLHKQYEVISFTTRNAPENMREQARYTVIQAMYCIKSLCDVFNQEKISMKSLRTNNIEDRDAANAEWIFSVENLQAFFTMDQLQRLAQCLVENYLTLNQEDLMMWHTDPEEWVIENSKAAWDYEVSACAEALLANLLELYNDLIFTSLSCWANDNADITGTSLLVKQDALLRAYGSNPMALKEKFNFDEWVNVALPQLLNNYDSEYAILRRRAVIFISQWVQVKCSAHTRPKLYQSISVILDRKNISNLFVVRFAAAMAVRDCVDDYEFKVEDFVPFLTQVVGCVLELQQEINSTELQLKLLNVLGILCERIGQHINCFADVIVNNLLSMWSNSELNSGNDDITLRGSILSVLGQLNLALNIESMRFQEVLIPIVRDIDCAKPDYIFEESLSLWHKMLQSSIECSDDLLGLFHNALHTLKDPRDTEHLKIILRIIESYVLLSPKLFAQAYGEQTLSSLNKYLGELQPSACQTISLTLEIFFCTVPFESYKDMLVSSGLLLRILETIVRKSEPTVVLVAYVSILSRVMIANPEYLVALIKNIRTNSSLQLSDLLQAWIDQFDNIGNSRLRKLNAMGLASFFSSANGATLSLLPLLLDIWFNVLNEVQETMCGDALIYWTEDNELQNMETQTTPESARKNQILKSDIVHVVNLSKFLQSQLNVAQNRDTRFHTEYLSKCDPVFVEQFISLINQNI